MKSTREIAEYLLVLALFVLLVTHWMKPAEAQQMYLPPIVIQQQQQRVADREQERDWERMKMKHEYARQLHELQEAAKRGRCKNPKEVCP